MKTKIFLLTISGILFTAILFAQRTFVSTYEAPDGCSGYTSALLPGGILVGGETINFGSAGTDMLITKTDFDGNLQWEKKIGSSGDDEILSFISTSGNRLVLLTTDNSIGPQLFSYILLDTSLNVISIRTFYVNGISYVLEARMIELQNGDFLICAITTDGVALININTLGALNWTKFFSTTLNPSPYFYSIRLTQAPLGNIFLSLTGAIGITGQEDLFLLIFDNLGNFISAKEFTGSGSVSLSGSSIYYSQLSDKIYIGGTANSSRFFVMKTDANANLEWSKSYNGTVMPFVTCEDVVFNSSNDEMTFVGGPNTGGFEIAKLDSSGNFIWSQGSIGFDEFAQSILFDPVLGYFVSGLSPSSTTTNLNQFIYRILPDGTRCNTPMNPFSLPASYVATSIAATFTDNGSFTLIDTTINYTVVNVMLNRVIDCDVQVGIEIPDSKNAQNISLSINNSILNLKVGKEFSGLEEVSIQDISGRLVLKQKPEFASKDLNLDISFLSRGTYILTVNSDTEYSSQKFVIN